MIRIPTGPVPKNVARTGSLVLGIASLVASLFLPQYAMAVRQVGEVLTALGLTLGKSEGL
jgi:4-hydroxybenzoate polyprenyltransferase